MVNASTVSILWAVVTVSEPRKDSRDNSVLPTSKDRVLSEGGKGAVDAVPMSDVTGAVVQSVATDAAAEDCYAPYRSDGGVGGSLTVPLVECRVSCNLFNGTAQVGVVESLPESNVDLILGNDLVRGEEVGAPVMTKDPVPAEVVEDEDQMNFPVCAVTRSMSRVEESRRVEAAEAVVTPSDPPVEDVDGDGESPDDPSLTNLFSDTSSEQLALECVDVDRFKDLQGSDPGIQELRSLAVENMGEEKGSCLYEKDGVLYRRWRPPHTSVDEGLRDVHQLVVPSVCRQELIRLAHDIPFAAHLGVRKTLERLRAEFYWPAMRADVYQHQTLEEFGVKHVRSSAYHPESQGALERYHQTLKNMMRKYCLEHTKDWDKGVPFLLFATREVPKESLGFSPNELVFAHHVRGPLSIVKEAWSSDVDTSKNLLHYVLEFKTRLSDTREEAKKNLEEAQGKMKQWYDRKARWREFQVGDEVLVLLPLQGQPLAAKFQGPYVVEKRLGETDYLVKTPDRQRSHQFCHMNMLKPYYRPLKTPVTTHHVVAVVVEEDDDDVAEVTCEFQESNWVDNEEAETTLRDKVSHLPPEQVTQLWKLMSTYGKVFASVPGRTDWTQHDVDVGVATPVKLPPYRVSPRHIKVLRKELKCVPCTTWQCWRLYLLKQDILHLANTQFISIGSARRQLNFRRQKDGGVKTYASSLRSKLFAEPSQEAAAFCSSESVSKVTLHNSFSVLETLSDTHSGDPSTDDNSQTLAKGVHVEEVHAATRSPKRKLKSHKLPQRCLRGSSEALDSIDVPPCKATISAYSSIVSSQFHQKRSRGSDESLDSTEIPPRKLPSESS
ncbi:hypothetical protein Pcinc_016573 [Petrolisthes cinctipes]|uniref:RNA-directed DNA polymerase n=1 Tax=Petrolisthes cinctipes TaxID=88211 RepID=A0AAE1FSE5_PETCI|nr:hypothetical protein Pcinc_016573 [Petrolisthes cinctipes]